MNSSVFVPLIIFTFLVLYIFVINPAHEEKTRAAKKAAKIVQEFGKDPPILYVFEGQDKRGGYEIVYALLNSGDMYSSGNVFELARAYSKDKPISDGMRIRTRKDVNRTLSLLPYHVPQQITNDSWQSFFQRRNATLNAKHLNDHFKGTMTSCYAVFSSEHPGHLVFTIWGEGKPFRYGTDYEVLYVDDYDTTQEDELHLAEEVLRKCRIKDKTIHLTEKTWDEAFEHYADGVTAI